VEGRTRRRLSRMVAMLSFATCALATVCASVGPPEQRGTFSLLGGTQKIASRLWVNHAAGLSVTLNVRQFAVGAPAPGKEPTPIFDYEIDMQKLMHLVVARDDFATFAHLHPTFDPKTGTFSQRFTKQPNHRYYIFVDTTPRSIGQQVFRFILESDGPLATSRRPSAASTAMSIVAPYRVTISGTTLPANQARTLGLTILERGRPAADLSTYLGAAAHAVFINTATLTYVHLHPMVGGSQTMAMGANMEMSGNAKPQAGPHLQMNAPALPAGIYRLWIEFSGVNNRVYTAPFTVLVH
jgi:hypothetical protein